MSRPDLFRRAARWSPATSGTPDGVPDSAGDGRQQLGINLRHEPSLQKIFWKPVFGNSAFPDRSTDRSRHFAGDAAEGGSRGPALWRHDLLPEPGCRAPDGMAERATAPVLRSAGIAQVTSRLHLGRSPDTVAGGARQLRRTGRPGRPEQLQATWEAVRSTAVRGRAGRPSRIMANSRVRPASTRLLWRCCQSSGRRCQPRHAAAVPVCRCCRSGARADCLQRDRHDWSRERAS